MLGWKITRDGDYIIDLPMLSKAEEETLLAVEEKFRLAAREKKIGPENVEKELAEAIVDYAEQEHFVLDSNQRSYLAKYAKMHIYGFAFMDELLENDSIEEISIIGVGKPAYVFVRKLGWQKVNAFFEDEKTIMDIINKMAGKMGRRITLQQPRLDAMLPNGSRLHASLHPISHGEITIRKFRQIPFSPKEIAELETANFKMMAFFSMLMQTDSSVIVAGNTASGKTTTLNALFSFVPRNERVLITEETPEISIPHEHQIRLVANREMGVTLKDLVYDSLRMRPDRMIVGEVRNREEVDALFDVLLGGQARGAYATFHAQSTNEALLRFEKFGITEMDMRSIDAIVIQRRMLLYNAKKRIVRETRKIVEISEIRAGEDNASKGKTIFSLSKSKTSWVYSSGELCEKIMSSLGLSAKEFNEEMLEREKWIMRAGSNFDSFFQEVQKKFYKFQ